MYKVISGLILLLTFLFACSDSIEQPYKNIVVKSEIKSVPYITDVFKIGKYVPLQTSPESLLKRIDAIKIQNDIMYTFSNGNVYVWSEKGKLIRKIGKQGRGPGEMLYLIDFALSPDGKKIAILDNYRERIFMFDKNGNLLESKKIDPRYATNLCWTQSNKFIFYSNYVTKESKKCTFFLTDSNWKNIKQLLPINPNELGNCIDSGDNFPTYGNRQYLRKSLDDMIYELTPQDELVPRYRVTFDKGNIDTEKLKKYDHNCLGLASEMKKNKLRSIVGFNETEHYYIIRYTIGEDVSTNIVLKNDHQQIRIQHRPRNFDPIGGFFTFYYGDYILMAVEPYKLKLNLRQMIPLAKKQLGESLPILEKIASEASDEDNPIILFLEYRSQQSEI